MTIGRVVVRLLLHSFNLLGAGFAVGAEHQVALADLGHLDGDAN